MFTILSLESLFCNMIAIIIIGIVTAAICGLFTRAQHSVKHLYSLSY